MIEKQLLQASVGIFIATFSFVRLLNLAIKGFEMTTTSRRKLSSKEIGRFQRSIYSFLCGLAIQQYINQVSFYFILQHSYIIKIPWFVTMLCFHQNSYRKMDKWIVRQQNIFLMPIMLMLSTNRHFE